MAERRLRRRLRVCLHQVWRSYWRLWQLQSVKLAREWKLRAAATTCIFVRWHMTRFDVQRALSCSHFANGILDSICDTLLSAHRDGEIALTISHGFMLATVVPIAR